MQSGKGHQFNKLSELILHRHIVPLGLCADGPRTPLHLSHAAAACAGIEQYVKNHILPLNLPPLAMPRIFWSYSLTSVTQQRSQALQRIPEYVCLAMLMSFRCKHNMCHQRGFEDFDDSASHLSERCIAVLLAENKCGNLQCLIIRDLPKMCHVLTNCTMTRTSVLLWLATRIPIQIRAKNL